MTIQQKINALPHPDAELDEDDGPEDEYPDVPWKWKTEEEYLDHLDAMDARNADRCDHPMMLGCRRI